MEERIRSAVLCPKRALSLDLLYLPLFVDVGGLIPRQATLFKHPGHSYFWVAYLNPIYSHGWPL